MQASGQNGRYSVGRLPDGAGVGIHVEMDKVATIDCMPDLKV